MASAEGRDDWATSYRAGATLDEIARAAGVSHMTVKWHLVRLGETLRRRGPRHPPPPPDWWDEAAALAQHGLPTTKIALLVGHTRQAVRLALVRRTVVADQTAPSQ